MTDLDQQQVLFGHNQYRVDQFWGKLPEGLVLGIVSTLAVAYDGALFMAQRNGPPVLVFEPDGTPRQSWPDDLAVETTPGVIGSTSVGRSLAFGIAEEVVDVTNARSIPVQKDVVLAMVEASFIQHANHEPSMLQDKRAGRKTEIETLNGAVAKFARDGGLSAPANTLVADLLRLAETGVAARANNHRVVSVHLNTVK